MPSFWLSLVLIIWLGLNLQLLPISGVDTWQGYIMPGVVLAFSAIRNNDKVGLILFTEEVEKFIPPRKGRRRCSSRTPVNTPRCGTTSRSGTST